MFWKRISQWPMDVVERTEEWMKWLGLKQLQGVLWVGCVSSRIDGSAHRMAFCLGRRTVVGEIAFSHCHFDERRVWLTLG